MKKTALISGIVFLILTIAGGIYVLMSRGQASAGYAVIPGLWCMMCFGFYRGRGDRYNVPEEKLSEHDLKSVSIADKSYVGYKTDAPNNSYGGDQRWFGELPEELGGKWLSTIGCGLTASCDMIFYMQRSRGMEDLTDLTLGNTDKQAFSRFAHYYIHNYMFKSFRDWKGVGGIFPRTLCNGLNRYFHGKGHTNYHFRFRYFISYSLSGGMGKQRFKADLYNMLSSDLPVIVRIGTGNVRRFPASAEKNTFHWHYVTVTEMDVDAENNKITLKCSSWGNPYTMDLDDLFRNAGLTGGMVIVEDQSMTVKNTV